MAGPGAKTRKKTETIRLGTSWSNINGAVSSFTSQGTSTFVALDRLLSSTNNLGPPLHSGIFNCSKANVRTFPMGFRENFLYNSALKWWMLAEGNFIPNIGQSLSGPYLGLDSDFWRTQAKGTEGWNKFRPGTGYKGEDGKYHSNPNMGVFLGELKDIPRIPSLLRNYKQRTRHLHREAGSDYLNHVFGWEPFVRDLLSFVEGTHNMAKALQQLRRDNDRGVRRKGKISEQESVITTVTNGSGFPPVLPSINALHFVGSWRKTVVQTNYERYGFAARFRYHIPDLGTPQWEERAIRRFYGSDWPPSPELVYNLIPWTWLIDWFTNVGATIANFSPQLAENLVADYATVTEYRRRVTDTSVEFNTNSGPKFCSVSIEQESKYRIIASPYGFGLTWDTFSPKQLAILAALGLSRS